MIVCLIGGFIGMVLGGIMGYAGTSLIDTGTFPTIESIVIAVGFSLGIGLFFGYYPANKAAKLDPIEALRYE
jgi:putative ABC transport system permease protein